MLKRYLTQVLDSIVLFSLTASTRLKYAVVAVPLIVAYAGCQKESRVTIIYGKVTDTSQQPVEGVKILIMAYRKGTLAQGNVLETLLTDNSGNYTVTVEPGKQYSTIDVINQYFNNPNLNDKYSSFIAIKDGQSIQQCCPANIGQKTEYDFKLIPK